MASSGVHARLASIHVYPLKAARAVDLDQSLVEPWGLAGDRRWLLVDDTGRFVSQREEPAMARVVVRAGHRSLTASAPGLPAIRIPAPCQEGGAELVRVTVWSSALLAAAAGPAADLWFSEYLGRPVQLVYLDDPTRREVDQDYGAAGDVVSFADGFPLLLTNSGSLDELGRWLTEDGDQPVPMNRFRPNVVVAGAGPWAEDGWRRIRIGEVSFRVVKPCGRCVVTTIDQASAARGRQPLKMLGRRRRFGQDLVFGQNMIPDASGVIRVGDPVEILERAQ
jgi:MOSC domain-containing protein